jgi:hypothetical protein
MQRAYGLVSRQMSPMSYMMYSIQHYILLCKMKFDNDLRHVSGLSRVKNTWINKDLICGKQYFAV